MEPRAAAAREPDDDKKSVEPVAYSLAPLPYKSNELDSFLSAEILELHGEDGGPPWLVRWGDDGHEGLFFPGSDAMIEHFPHQGDASAS